ncbi:MAG: SAM-dependent chlorinase/fluorinase [Pseudomonadota bacterium]
MQRSGVITITTDVGHKGPFTAVMKGVIYSRFPEARIVDIAEDVPVHWPPEAEFWVSRSYPYFPPGSVHLVIVDPALDGNRDILLIDYDSHFFVAPDNGLLARFLDDADGAQVFKLDIDCLPRLGIPEPDLCFHGRDVFAPVVAELAAGRTTPVSIGKACQAYTPAWLEPPEVGSSRIKGTVITFDSFGNLITNIEASHLDGLRATHVQIGGQTIPVLDNYAEATPGDYLALINSFGVVEIARAEGSAAESLGIERGAPVIAIG